MEWYDLPFFGAQSYHHTPLSWALLLWSRWLSSGELDAHVDWANVLRPRGERPGNSRMKTKNTRDWCNKQKYGTVSCVSVPSYSLPNHPLLSCDHIQIWPLFWLKPQFSASKSDLDPERAGVRPLKWPPKLGPILNTVLQFRAPILGSKSSSEASSVVFRSALFLEPVFKIISKSFWEGKIRIPYGTSLKNQGVAAYKKRMEIAPPKMKPENHKNQQKA